MKRFITLCLTVVTLLSVMTTAFAMSEDYPPITDNAEFLLSEIEYAQPESQETMESSMNLLLSREQIDTMTVEEIIAFLEEHASYAHNEIPQLAAYLKSDDYENNIAPTYGIYDHPVWIVHPYISVSKHIAVVKDKWIGIDAYTSSTGMSKSKSETTEVSVKLGYTGDSEIKKEKSLTVEGTVKHSFTVSASVTCEAWHYVAWRPYIVYREDTWKGTMKVRTVIPTGTGVYENTWYDYLEGTHQYLVAKNTQMWDQENIKRDRNAATPVPPTAPPTVAQP